MKKIIIFIIGYSMLFTLSHTVEHKTTILIDPGHGGIDGGCIVDNIKESNLNLEISLLLKQVYEEHGYDVILTRDNDFDLATSSTNRHKSDLDQRIKIINSSNADLVLSIHQNSFSDKKYYGLQCFYKNGHDASKLVATNIQSTYNLTFDNKRLAKPSNSIYLLNNITKNAVLIECGFMTNDVEFKLLNDKLYQKKLVNNIFYGTMLYLYPF